MLTLLELAKTVSNPIAAGVIETIAGNNPVLEAMPFIDVQGTAYRYNREDTLPDIAFRGINESFTESTGVINPQTETLVISGGDMDFDTALVKMGNGNERAIHDQMKAKAHSLKWLVTFFDGDSDAEPREFDGVNKRLEGTSQVIDNGDAVLDLENLDALIDAVDGEASQLLMSKRMARIVTKLAQGTGNVSFGLDAIGRRRTEYAGIPIGIVENDHQNNLILDFDEASSTNSIYAVRYGLDGVHGIQNGAIDARDLGEIDSKPAFRTRVEWLSGYAVKHPRAIARLTGITNATA